MNDVRTGPATRRWFRRLLVVLANLLLVAAIVGIIAATWLPAILDEGPGDRRERPERRLRR